MELKILGQPYSKANSRRLVSHNNKPMFIKSQEALSYQQSALWQLKTQVKQTYTGPVAVEMTIYYKTQRPDLDESLILDIMEKAGVYKNDRQVKQKHIFHGIDKENPRAEILVWEIG